MENSSAVIVLKSIHHQNSEKVARAIADVLNADIVTPEEATAEMISTYRLVGFGSGIYFGRFHSTLRECIKRMESSNTPQQAFIFSTAGMPCLQLLWHGPFKKQLSRRGFKVIGEFCCRGHDTVGPLWLIGGLNRGHPSDHDLSMAADFARELLSRL